MKELEADIRKKALKFRHSNGLGATEPINLQSLIMKLGILAVFRNLGSEFSGMAQIKQGYKFMMINSGHSLGRQNFTICHEIYHLCIQENFDAMVCKAGEFPNDDEVELAADFFASHFLIPEEGVFQLIPIEEIGKDKISLQTILFIEHYYGCSRMALLRTLKKRGIISGKAFNSFSFRVIPTALENGYDRRLYATDSNDAVETIVGDYGQLAKRVYDAGLLNETSYFNALHDAGVTIGNSEIIERADEEC